MCATLSELAPPLDMILPDVTVIDLTATSSLQRPVELLFEEAGHVLLVIGQRSTACCNTPSWCLCVT